MSRIGTTLLAIALCLPHAAHAQSDAAFAGYLGLVFTPVGAFAPVVTGVPAAGASSIGGQLRVSRWQYAGDDDATTNIGAGVVFSRGRARTTLELGYAIEEGCGDCGFPMAGVDVQFDLAHSSGNGPTLLATLNPAFGFGKPSDGEGSVATVGMSVPLSASFDAGAKARIVPFVSPGFGFSRVSFFDESQTGSRATVSGGVSLGSQSSPLLFTVSARKIFLKDAPTIYGIGLMLAR